MQSPAFRSAHSQWTVILRQHFCLETGDHSWSLGRWEGRTPLPNVVWDILLMAGAGAWYVLDGARGWGHGADVEGHFSNADRGRGVAKGLLDGVRRTTVSKAWMVGLAH